MHQKTKSRPRNWQSVWSATLIFVALKIAIFAAANAQAATFAGYFPLGRAEKTVPLADQKTPLPTTAECLPAELATAWAAYRDAWSAHHADPADDAARLRLFGSTEDPLAVSASNGRALSTMMRLPLRDSMRYESKHFVMLSDASTERSTKTLRDIEKFYHVWTQLFFPVWSGNSSWDHTAIAHRRSPPSKHRLVLVSDANRYRSLVGNEGFNASESTGFYSDSKRVTFLSDDPEHRETLFHELTHQLLGEAIPVSTRTRAGDRENFWLVEGIACYMESTHLLQQHASIGGWHASRLQYVRHSILSGGEEMRIEFMQSEGRAAVQRRTDLAKWYGFAAAHTHAAIDANDGAGLISVLHELGDVYQLRINPLAGCDQKNDLPKLRDYLTLTDEGIAPLTDDLLRQLCLTRTEVTTEGLNKISPQTRLLWLDLSFLKISNDDVRRLCPSLKSLTQLSLESTGVDDSLAEWFKDAGQLRELDLSNTRAGDAILQAIPPEAPVETLWLTGSQVSDASIEHLLQFSTLRQIDIQSTNMTQRGVEKMRAAFPGVKINPLEVQTR